MDYNGLLTSLQVKKPQYYIKLYRQQMHKTTKINWKDGVPSSGIYDDIYFSKESGLLEARHVFLDGNNLSARWEAKKQDFHIIELGFGTGLNFLASWQLWSQKNTGAKLHFTSIEKHPLSVNDLYQSMELWPELALYYKLFINKSNLLGERGGVLHLDDNKVELRVIYGDVNDMLPSVNISADAWFLDGFAPAKNPDMWNENIYSNMARLTNPGGTFATFTAVGNVRRGLQQHGFKVSKIPGFGKKRHILAGIIANS